MAKRRQSRGIPKPKTDRQADADSAETGRFGLGKPLSEYKTRAEREAAIQKRVVWGVSVILIAVVALVAITIIYERLIQPNQTIAEVNGVEISADEFRSRVEFERLIVYEQINTVADQIIQSQGLDEGEAANQAVSTNPALREAYSESQTNDQIGLRVLNSMIEDQLIRTEAEARGITVTREDINKEIERLLGFDSEANAIALDPERTPEAEPTSTPSPTPFVSPTPRPTSTATPESTGEATEAASEPTALPTVPSAQTRTPQLDKQVFENNLERFYERADLLANYSRDDVDAYFELKALRTKLAEAVVESPNTETWVSARRIVVETEEEAQEVLDALNAGQPFAELAQALSIDNDTAANGGEMFALPLESIEITPEITQQFGFGQDYLDAISEGQPGELIGPVPATLREGAGFQIIQIISREERDLTEEQIRAKLETKLTDWLDALRDENSDSITINDNWPDLVPTGPSYAPRSRG